MVSDVRVSPVMQRWAGCLCVGYRQTVGLAGEAEAEAEAESLEPSECGGWVGVSMTREGGEAL